MDNEIMHNVIPREEGLASYLSAAAQSFLLASRMASSLLRNESQMVSKICLRVLDCTLDRTLPASLALMARTKGAAAWRGVGVRQERLGVTRV